MDNNSRILSRRNFIKVLSALSLSLHSQNFFGNPLCNTFCRDFSVCLTPDAIIDNPFMIKRIAQSGVNRVWIITYFYGFWPWTEDLILNAKRIIVKNGMEAVTLTCPLGHPGDALASKDGNIPLTPPSYWSTGITSQGKTYVGTIIDEISVEENCKALKKLHSYGFKKCILDDDFRIAMYPGSIGGNFNEINKSNFLKQFGYNESFWDILLNDINNRNYSSILIDWVNWQCDKHFQAFKKMKSAFRDGDLGYMIMYLGAEKAGIKLSGIGDITLRVGEEHFNDASFESPKGWTNELFSVLFHRRFIAPENAWSETTSFPAASLSPENLVTKLNISTITDVRHTIFMSGVQAYPQNYWDSIGPAIKKQRILHEKVRGYKLCGPFKHYWGLRSRYVGLDAPFSLWLALGVPFEVISNLDDCVNSWIFITEEDIPDIKDAKCNNYYITNTDCSEFVHPNIRIVEENLNCLWNWKKTLFKYLEKMKIPYVIENSPCICAWYPELNAVLLWNLKKSKEILSIKYQGKNIPCDLDGLEMKYVNLF
ncbi:hypothetical protein [Parabacteroides pacaensis]|uniref:hypothetical protein n=1 Tax=Parabacteroides pacaensis TaxID=2086575 RepID=UPI00131B3A1E|nr:hypothetical protein [Parabacteroides pacaensis]